MINNKEYKIGDIIYPFYNGTLGFFKRPIWKVVIEIGQSPLPKGRGLNREV